LGGIFISYRREDTAGSAGRIYDRLVERFGRENVFFDRDDIPLGSDFAHVLMERVRACDALVAVIGKQWMISDETKRRRLDDPEDFVRIEIEAALDGDVRVIPALVEGAGMPKPTELPETLKKLAHKQAIEISHSRFNSDVETLARSLASLEKRIRRAASRNEVPPTAGPRNVGELTPKVDLLFSPKDSGSSLVPKLEIGKSGVFLVGPSDDFGKLLFPALTEAQFKVESIGGQIKVSTKIIDDKGHLIVEINRNEWQVAPSPKTWDRNYSDDALEVKDDEGRIILQVRALSDRIQLQGIWWVDLGPPNGVTRMTIWRGTDPRKGPQIVFTGRGSADPLPEIDPIFVYPSERHLGELRAK
jgi:hypothetical protein